MTSHERLARLAITLAATGLVAAACAQAAPSTASQPPQAAAPKASAAAAAPAATSSIKPFIPVGKFAVVPAKAAAGATVTASATGLAPKAAYDLVWSTGEGKWTLFDDKIRFKGREFGEVRSKLGTVTTDAAGAFSAPFVVPSGFGFLHDVMVTKGDEIVNKFGFNVDMEVTISPTSGPVGTPITIDAKGVGWMDMYNSWMVSYDNKFTGWLSSVTTNGYAKAVIPATGHVGTHIITIMHGHAGIPYLSGQQSPWPDRGWFRIPFTITEGPAVLPPPVTTQSFPDAVQLPERRNLWLEPGVGNVGSKTTLRAAGLRPNTEVEIAWSELAMLETMAGNLYKYTRPMETKVVGTARTDAQGGLEWAYTIGDVNGGLHPMEVRAGGQVLARTAFFVQPSVAALKVDRGPSGTETVVQVNGLYTTETGKIVNLVYDNAFVGYACSFNSRGNVQIFFRVSGEPGWHFIDVYPGIYLGEETNPINYRIPQLTALTDHPGEKMPIFRLAFLITAP